MVIPALRERERKNLSRREEEEPRWTQHVWEDDRRRSLPDCGHQTRSQDQGPEEAGMASLLVEIICGLFWCHHRQFRKNEILRSFLLISHWALS
jgi:hypothetical protein